MNERVERYLQAGTRDNTRRSYQAAVEHFEVSWGGFLPATADSIARYLVDHAEQHSINTLKQRLAALAQWHTSQGFPDPTKAPLVKQLLKGIRATHPAQPKQAAPLLVGQLEQVVATLEACAWRGAELHDHAMVLRARRDIALLLIGFWRGFRGDELARLEVQHIRAEPGTGMTLYLPHSKGDRLNQGVSYRAPALKRLCPVQAYGNWITAAGIAYGPVFRRIDRWGNLGAQGLHPNSLIPLLRGVLERGGLPAALYSSHSLRRGFATWANANGWDIKALMTYVGWKDMKSALRYIDPEMPFANLALAPG